MDLEVLLYMVSNTS